MAVAAEHATLDQVCVSTILPRAVRTLAGGPAPAARPHDHFGLTGDTVAQRAHVLPSDVKGTR